MKTLELEQKKAMIKPQELRIGNYVEYNGEIIKLDGSLFCCYIQNELEFPIKPIHITEEILLKFGFEKEGGYLSIGKLRGAITVCKAERESDSLCYRWFVNNIKMTDLHFVHQLQNLFFALTNEELIFKN